MNPPTLGTCGLPVQTKYCNDGLKTNSNPQGMRVGAPITPHGINPTTYSGSTYVEGAFQGSVRISCALSQRTIVRNFADQHHPAVHTYVCMYALRPQLRRATNTASEITINCCFLVNTNTTPSFPPRARLQPARQCPCALALWACGCRQQPCALGSCVYGESGSRRRTGNDMLGCKLRTVSNPCLCTRSSNTGNLRADFSSTVPDKRSRILTSETLTRRRARQGFPPRILRSNLHDTPSARRSVSPPCHDGTSPRRQCWSHEGRAPHNHPQSQKDTA